MKINKIKLNILILLIILLIISIFFYNNISNQSNSKIIISQYLSLFENNDELDDDYDEQVIENQIEENKLEEKLDIEEKNEVYNDNEVILNKTYNFNKTNIKSNKLYDLDDYALQNIDFNASETIKISYQNGLPTKHNELPFHLNKSDTLVKQQFDHGRHIISTFFHRGYRDARFLEILSVLITNLENPYITGVHLLYENEDPMLWLTEEQQKKYLNKLHRVKVKKQPTYRAMFQYANKYLKRGTLAIITNADIYFDESIECVKPVYPEHPKFNSTKRLVYALSRRHSPICGKKPDEPREKIFDLCLQYGGSHDSFIFAPPMLHNVMVHTQHTQNQGLGAENIVIWEIQHEKSYVKNPCKMIKSYHLHCTKERHYVTRFINGYSPYKKQSRYKLRNGKAHPGNAKSKQCGDIVY